VNHLEIGRRSGRSKPEAARVIGRRWAAVHPISVPAPAAGTYLELVDSANRPTPLQYIATAPGDPLTVTVPSNYGYILVSPA
jgi:hypothetical protein